MLNSLIDLLYLSNPNISLQNQNRDGKEVFKIVIFNKCSASATLVCYYVYIGENQGAKPNIQNTVVNKEIVDDSNYEIPINNGDLLANDGI